MTDQELCPHAEDPAQCLHCNEPSPTSDMQTTLAAARRTDIKLKIEIDEGALCAFKLKIAMQRNEIKNLNKCVKRLKKGREVQEFNHGGDMEKANATVTFVRELNAALECSNQKGSAALKASQEECSHLKIDMKLKENEITDLKAQIDAREQEDLDAEHAKDLHS